MKAPGKTLCAIFMEDRAPKRNPDVSMEVATHTGKRLRIRGLCEKCDTPTNWTVRVNGRVGVFWCGCGN